MMKELAWAQLQLEPSMTSRAARFARRDESVALTPRETGLSRQGAASPS